MRQRSAYRYLLVICLASFQTGFAYADTDKDDNNAKGPDQVIIQSTIDTEKVAKPAYLPHRAHQWLECNGCHHGRGTDGKMAEIAAGQKIEKCETCHNSKTGMPEMIATLKRASHKLCMECHLQQDKELARCSVCHTKKQS